MAINPSVGAGMISAGSQLLGGVFSGLAQNQANKTNLRIARENNAANQQLQANQNSWNLDQWNRENAYNSASSQKQRLIDAGFNPSLAVGQVATGSAQSSQLNSAPYTPANQVSVSPVNYASGISNAGNDLVSSYLNARLNSAQIEKMEAEAQQAKAEAAATGGYRADMAKSGVQLNGIMANLYDSQRALNDIHTELQTRWGSQQAVANLEATVSSRLKSEQDRITSDKQARLYVAEAVKSYAQTANIKADTNMIYRTVDSIVEGLQLKNRAQEHINQSLSVNAQFENQYGFDYRRLGYQSLDKQNTYQDRVNSLKQKENTQFWWKSGVETFSDLMGSFRDFGIGSKMTSKPDIPDDYGDFDKHETSYKDPETGRTIKDTYYRKQKVRK